MVSADKRAILLTGATAGVKGFALSAPVAIGKFAPRGLAQSAARELSPPGIHVAHYALAAPGKYPLLWYRNRR
jgi:NAD(P)-dependent dehydrogenase (short-subunit alcohol dehydrogenase family)